MLMCSVINLEVVPAVTGWSRLRAPPGNNTTRFPLIRNSTQFNKTIKRNTTTTQRNEEEPSRVISRHAWVVLSITDPGVSPNNVTRHPPAFVKVARQTISTVCPRAVGDPVVLRRTNDPLGDKSAVLGSSGVDWSARTLSGSWAEKGGITATGAWYSRGCKQRVAGL